MRIAYKYIHIAKYNTKKTVIKSITTEKIKLDIWISYVNEKQNVEKILIKNASYNE